MFTPVVCGAIEAGGGLTACQKASLDPYYGEI